MAILYTTDNLEETILPGNMNKFTLEELQHWVKGYIEEIYLQKAVMYLIVNEDGKYKNMAYNKLASEVAGQPIVGQALLCHPSELD